MLGSDWMEIQRAGILWWSCYREWKIRRGDNRRLYETYGDNIIVWDIRLIWNHL